MEKETLLSVSQGRCLRNLLGSLSLRTEIFQKSSDMHSRASLSPE